jgi:hypothetical protein
MSDQSIIALTAIVITGVVTLGTSLLTFLSRKAEREERYRLQFYEKTLATYQDAFNWMMRLVDPIERARELSGPDGHLPDGFLNALERVYSDAREWWDAHCLYLDEEPRASAFDFIEVAGAYVRGDLTPSQDEIYSMRGTALRAIQEGIGKKHLPKFEGTPAQRTSHE